MKLGVVSNDSLPHFFNYIRKSSKSSLKFGEKILRRDEDGREA